MCHVSPLAASVLLGWLAAPTTAQLTDIQPGRNFPTATIAFGNGRTENIDVGDIDNDGDADVVTANGGDGSAQVNSLYLNEGGLQGGVEGTFTDVTAIRYLGIPDDTARDVELADIDGDFDLDIFIATRGNTINNGEVSRAYVNQGGAQLGTIGYFSEGTEDFWGDLESVPLGDEVGIQDGHGPWKGFSCDCDFGDLDDDGNLDVFVSTYGPNINGTRDSRIFLNDGLGQFDELWPWADPAADIRLHALDVSLLDLDGDIDLDVFVTSLYSQSRVYRNNLGDDGWTTDPFTDLTQSALLNTFATQSGNATWESAYGDLDGDGDFDFWVNNYVGFNDRILSNNGDFTFTRLDTIIKADPHTDEEDCDLLDYDGDGDLDVMQGNFSGTNWLYQSGVAQGLTAAQGLYHRTGSSAGGGLANRPELPESGNGQTTKDVDIADLDGDGDPDILLANDSNGSNRVYFNVLGIPDTHAPVLQLVTEQGDAAGPEPTVIHTRVCDNSGDKVVAFYDAFIFYSVDGGPTTCVSMVSQGGMQFRGVIPALEGSIEYYVEVTDQAGNTGVSASTMYVHSGVPAAPLWQLVDCGTPGIYGRPMLELSGDQTAGSTLTLVLRDAAPDALFLLWLATPTSTPADAFGGTVHALPFGDEFLLTTDSGGMFRASVLWPAGVPSGTEHFWQCLVGDASSVFGIVLSNAVQGTAP